MQTPSPLNTNQLQTHFNEMSGQYDALIHRRFSCYGEMLDTLFLFTDLAGIPAPRILELGVGTGNLSLRALKAYPQAEYTLLDLSPEMLALTESKINEMGKMTHYQMIQTSFMEAPFEEGQFDLIISSLALHHLTNDEKPVLYRRIFKWLKPSGLFRFSDGHYSLPVKTAHPAIWQVSIDACKALGVSDEEIAMWQAHEKQYDHFAPLSQHFTWLQQAGFIEVDCYWKNLLLAILGGQKPA